MSELLSEKKLELKDISEIYLVDNAVSWNSSRLVTLFAKTITSFSNIRLFVRKIEDKESLNIWNKDKLNLKSFILVERSESLQPIYKNGEL